MTESTKKAGKQRHPFQNNSTSLPLLPSLSSDLHLPPQPGQAVPADIQLHSQAIHCDDSHSRVMGSDTRFVPGLWDRNTPHSPHRVSGSVWQMIYRCDSMHMCRQLSGSYEGDTKSTTESVHQCFSGTSVFKQDYICYFCSDLFKRNPPSTILARQRHVDNE